MEQSLLSLGVVLFLLIRLAFCWSCNSKGERNSLARQYNAVNVTIDFDYINSIISS